MSRHRRHRRSKVWSLYVWHRYLGIAAAILVMVLALTGLLLNHTDRLALDSRHVSSPWLLDWYGIEVPPPRIAFAAGDAFVTLLGRRLYHDLEHLPGEHAYVAGALRTSGILVVATDSEVMLLAPGGELIERMGTDSGLPGDIRRLGEDADGLVVVEGEEGIFATGPDFLRWQSWQGEARAVAWARPTTLPATVRDGLAARYRAGIMPLERVVLDLHSGRILGRYGHLVMDGAAVLMLLLAGTGFFLWLRRRR